MSQTAEPIRLNPDTLGAFQSYVGEAEAAMRAASEPFLWADGAPDRASDLSKGKVLAHPWSGAKPIPVPHGLIHDWIGAAGIAHATLAQVLAVMQDYDNHQTIYKPEVLTSKLLSRDGNAFQIFLRLLKKKVISVVLDTEHDVQYTQVSATRWTCWSATSRISEVQNAGTKDERVLPPDTGYGFLWRLNSYWRLEEKPEGVAIECRAISLTRDVPTGLAWVIDPIIRKLPKEYLVNTLSATRRAAEQKLGGARE